MQGRAQDSRNQSQKTASLGSIYIHTHTYIHTCTHTHTYTYTQRNICREGRKTLEINRRKQHRLDPACYPFDFGETSQGQSVSIADPRKKGTPRGFWFSGLFLCYIRIILAERRKVNWPRKQIREWRACRGGSEFLIYIYIYIYIPYGSFLRVDS